MKRKRITPNSEELEINIDAPEPPSKKVLRRARKGKTVIAVTAREGSLRADIASEDERSLKAAPLKRSEYGIWIGNLPWSATKEDVRSFITTSTDITDEQITRLHMPAPMEAVIGGARQNIKHQNKGFAYVDFAAESQLIQALALSEKLLRGRRVLIKDSKSFEGRPEKPKHKDGDTAAEFSGKPPSRRIFVGNLAFDVSKEDLQSHFAPCGTVVDVHVATFEDSGKCKGYAWVNFADLEAGEAAVRGWVWSKVSNGEKDGKNVETRNEAKTKKIPKPRKWWVNVLKGRDLRMEFAEDKSVRYKKRFGKDGSARNNHSTHDSAADQGEEVGSPTPNGETTSTAIPPPSKPQPDPAPLPSPSRKSPALKSKSSRISKKIDARNGTA
jgi:hypothetical protein